MSKSSTQLCVIILFFCLGFINLNGQEVFYGPDFITFEAEATTSSLTKWTLRQKGDADYQKYVTQDTGVDPVFDSYLEYTGPWQGGVDTELEYKFTCQKTGNYRMLMRMHQPLLTGEAGDQRNDVFVRLEGNYTSATDKPVSELTKNHKFWGRGVNKWGSCHKLEIGSHMEAVYGLTKGEEYTLVMSGRSTGTCIDYILFYEYSSQPEIPQGEDVATFFPENYRPGLGLVDPVSLAFATDSSDLRTGTSMTLPITWQPENSKKDLIWTSSDEAIVSVNENGVITALGITGDKAIVYAKSSVNTTTDSIVISIVDWYAVDVESISVLAKSNILAESFTVQLTVGVNPSYADNQNLIWTSADTSIVTVDSLGLVTATGAGKVQIRASSVADATIYDEVEITVAELFMASIAYDDESKYLTTEYQVGQTLPFSVDYHAGTFNTVTDVKVWLRHMQSGWSAVVKDYIPTIPSGITGTESGTLSLDLDLAGVTSSADLPVGDFYFLFVKFFFSDGTEMDKGLNPINIVAAPASLLSDHEKTISIYPNPAKEYFFLDVKDDVTVLLYNSLGDLMLSQHVSKDDNKIYTASLTSGLYYVKTIGHEMSLTQKIIVE